MRPISKRINWECHWRRERSGHASGQGHEIVFADALEDEEHNGGATRIRDEVRPSWRTAKIWRRVSTAASLGPCI